MSYPNYVFPRLFDNTNGRYYAYAYTYDTAHGPCIALIFPPTTDFLLKKPQPMRFLVATTTVRTTIRVHDKLLLTKDNIPKILLKNIQTHKDKIVMLTILSEDGKCTFTHKEINDSI